MRSVSSRTRRVLAVSALALLLSGSVAFADDSGLIHPPGTLQQIIAWIFSGLSHPPGMRVQK